MGPQNKNKIGSWNIIIGCNIGYGLRLGSWLDI